MLGNSFKSKNTPSVIALSRQKLPYINPKFSEKMNVKMELVLLEWTHTVMVTLVASGSEVELALDIYKMLKQNNIEAKVVSMPCQELFDKQSNDFKENFRSKFFNCFNRSWQWLTWKKYVGEKGVTVGINRFGKSAPYKSL